ncbi:MAG: hypothetical protein E5Y81_24240, partial [Mesorhizobium sp.]
MSSALAAQGAGASGRCRNETVLRGRGLIGGRQMSDPAIPPAVTEDEAALCTPFVKCLVRLI